MAEFTMTDKQRGLARHALGLPNRNQLSYRNHFVTGAGSDDWDDWQTLVAAGYATRGNPGPLTGGDYLFWLTRTGAFAALEPGEALEGRRSLREKANG